MPAPCRAVAVTVHDPLMTDSNHSPSRRGRVIRPGDGAAINQTMTHKVDTGDVESSIAIIEGVLPPGQLVAPHTHRQEDEITYVIEGEVTFEIGADVLVAPAGSYVLKPRGVSHAFWSSGGGDARVMEIHAPGGFERFYDDMEQVAVSSGSDDERVQRFRETAARYGVEHHIDQVDDLRARHELA
jgi:quercetin dioxygenase-like cupin family protein